jgi:hypothetical protein
MSEIAPASGSPAASAWLAALLGAWLGAAVLFAAVVAPAAFAVLPTRALAGALVGRVLPVVLAAGALVGIAAAAGVTLAPLGRGGRLLCLVCGAVAAAACAAARWWVGGRIESLRAAIGPSLDALAADDPRRVAFGRLHGVSVMLLGVAMLAGLIALAAYALAARRAAAQA